MTLYGGWSESLAGTGFTMSLSGERSGPLDPIRYSGEATWRYLHVSKGQYLMSMEKSVLLPGASGPAVSSELYWSGASDVAWEDAGSETIPTRDGMIECRVFRGTGAGGVQTQYIGAADGVLHRMTFEARGPLLSVREVYEFERSFSFEPDPVCDVAVVTDVGISAEGAGRYAAGSCVELSAEGGSFAGWYDGDMGFVTGDRVLRIPIVGSDAVFYAMNRDPVDFAAEEGAEADLGDYLEGDAWTVYGEGMSVVAELDGPAYAFPGPGAYLVVAEGGGGRTCCGVGVGSAVRSYAWEFDGARYACEADIPYADLLRCRGSGVPRGNGDDAHVLEFVTPEDPRVAGIAERLSELAGGMGAAGRAGLALSFVQSLEYQDDPGHTGRGEYWKFPLETLYDSGGDCEDTSFLFCSIAEAMGLDCALMVFPGHMAAGVRADGCAGEYGDGYCYCETTSPSGIGPDWKDAEFRVGVHPPTRTPDACRRIVPVPGPCACACTR